MGFDKFANQKPGEKVLGLAMDSSRSTYWLYTNNSLYEILAVEEDRDVWSAYLEKNEHAAALVYAKVRRESTSNSAIALKATFPQTTEQRNTIILSKAKLLSSQGKFIEAAQSFSKTNAPFEKVVLDFVDRGQTDALRTYISAKLESTRKMVRYQQVNQLRTLILTRAIQDLARRVMLATWLAELYLRKYSELEDVINAGLLSQDMTDRKEELAKIDQEFRLFLQMNTVTSTFQAADVLILTFRSEFTE